MSWLLLDVGNSTLKWSLVAQLPAPAAGSTAGFEAARPEATYAQGALAIDAPDLTQKLAAEWSKAFASTAEDTPPRSPTAAWGCAVAAPDRIAAIAAALHLAGSPAAQWFGAEADFDFGGIVLHNGYCDPQQLGADRWHALIGARARFAHGALLVVNAGTATTVDAIGADGRFLGGVIAPGVALMRASLARGTARLPLAAGRYVAHPDNTDDAICTGVLDAQIGLIVQRLQRIRESVDGAVQVVVSGGNGPLLLGLLRGQAGLGTMTLEPDLVLLGLWHRAHAQTTQRPENRNQ